MHIIQISTHHHCHKELTHPRNYGASRPQLRHSVLPSCIDLLVVVDAGIVVDILSVPSVPVIFCIAVFRDILCLSPTSFILRLAVISV